MDTSLDLEFNPDQLAIINAVTRFCEQRKVEEHARHPERPFPRTLWRALAQLGVFAPAAPEFPGSGGALEICAICETLGRQAFPGPVQSTFLAMQVLGESEAQEVMNGDSIVCVSRAGDTLLPWGNEADIFLVIDQGQISRARAPAGMTTQDTLGGETWARGTLQIMSSMQNNARALAVANIAVAAYLAASGLRLIELASEHAGNRRQFGKPLGDFQAVTHPLADAAIWITAAVNLARTAASGFDLVTGMKNGADLVAHKAAGAAMSARRAALNAAFCSHQVFGAMGVTLEGPVFHYSRRIRQLASLPPANCGEQEQLMDFAGLWR